ncbi:MAG: hypothetical protein COA86_11875 [Kangiella sp.]|nr:MAG: hypothetical protein COA86_11875 [Kangiella sp.]
MIKITPQHDFKKLPWKNGKGSTLELAINENGSVDNFEWRLSIATVKEDGRFSDFSGYTRNLVLIDGKGIVLHHNENQTDYLENKLDFSTFDGANKTTAILSSGAITDFNLMTRTRDFEGVVETFSELNQIVLKHSQICFIYGLSNSLKIESKELGVLEVLPAGDLMQISKEGSNEIDVKVSGENFILVYINKRT